MSKCLTKPHLYQIEDNISIDQFEGRCWIQHDMSLGKTFESLYWASWHSEARPILVICPAGLKYQWQFECRKHFNWHSEVLCTRSPPRGFDVFPKIAIISPEILPYWVKWLLRMRPQLIIVDECHNGYGNPDTQRCKALTELVRESPYFLPLSGTPLVNNVMEMFHILSLLAEPRLDKIDPKHRQYFQYRRCFGEHFAIPTMTRNGWEYKGAKNTKQLHKLLRKYFAIRRLKSEVFAQLPEKQQIVVNLDIGSKEEYQSEVKKLVAWWDNNKEEKSKVIVAKSKLQKILQLVARLKMPYIYEWIDNFLETSEQGLVIAAIHRSIISKLKKKYKKQSLIIDGSVPPKDRLHIVELFQKKKEYRLLICNVKAAGVGLNIKGKSATLATIQLWWNPATHNQMESRIHGQGRGIEGVKTVSYYLIANNTIEQAMVKKIEEKQSISDAVLDGKDTLTEFNLFTQLIQELKKEVRR